MVTDDLKWEDLVSPTMSPDDYLKEYLDVIEYNYKSYKPKLDILEKISRVLEEKKETLRIVALGADWCPDSRRNLPRMIKIVKLMKNKDVRFKILFGIVTNPLHFGKPGESVWHKELSPSEANDSKFDLKRVPTFYFFNKSGDLLGIIIENPKLSSTLEEDLLEILGVKL